MDKNKIICDKCAWSWDIVDGGDDLYTCHKCNHDNTPNNLMENMIKEDKIKGGLSDKMSKKDIANKWNVTVAKINKEIQMGAEVEMEHVSTRKLATEIAMDHLVEIPDYYTRLKKMEKEGDKYWKGKEKGLNESTKDFIQRRIRENLIH